MKYVMSEGSYQEEFLDLDVQTVKDCIRQTRREYPRVIKMIFWNLAYPVTVRDDGTGWVRIPKGLLKKHLAEHDVEIRNKVRWHKGRIVKAFVKELKRLAKLQPRKYKPGNSNLEGIKYMVWSQDFGWFILDKLKIMSYPEDNIGDLPKAEALYDKYTKEAFHKYGYSHDEIEEIFRD